VQSPHAPINLCIFARAFVVRNSGRHVRKLCTTLVRYRSPDGCCQQQWPPTELSRPLRCLMYMG